MVKLNIELETGDAINEVVSRKEVVVRSNTSSLQGLSCLTSKKLETMTSANSETTPVWTAVTLRDINLSSGQELVFDFAQESEVLSVTLGSLNLKVGDYVLLKKQMASSYLGRLNKGITSLIPPFNPVILGRQLVECGRISKFIPRGAVLRTLSSEHEFFASNEELMFSAKASSKKDIENLRRTFASQLDVLPGDRVELGGSLRRITSCRIPLTDITQKKVTLERSPLVSFSVESLKNITRDQPCKNPPKATIKISGPRSYTICFFTRDGSSVVGTYVDNGTLHMEIIDPQFSKLTQAPSIPSTIDQTVPQPTLVRSTTSSSSSTPLSTSPIVFSSHSRPISVTCSSLSPSPQSHLFPVSRPSPALVAVCASSGSLSDGLYLSGSKRERIESVELLDESPNEPLNKLQRSDAELCPN